MKKLISVLIIIIFSINLVACKSKNDILINFDLNGEPKNLDPQTTTDNASLTVLNNILEGLLTIDQNGKIINAIAKDYEISNDKKVYTFNLKTDIKWIGKKDHQISLTAKDFVFAFQRLFTKETNSPHASKYFSIKNAQAVLEGQKQVSELGVIAKGDYELEITLDKPDDSFLLLLTQVPAMPCNEEFFLSTKGKYGLEYDMILSNSAFKITRWRHNDNIRLAKNMAYYNNTQVKVSQITLWIETKTAEQKKAEKKTGIPINNTVDRLINSKIVAGTVDGFEIDKISQKGFNTEAFQSGVWGIGFNQNNKVLANKNIRLAISETFDRSLYQERLPKSLEQAENIIPNSVYINGELYRELAGEIAKKHNQEQAMQHYKTGLQELSINKISTITMIAPKMQEVDLIEPFMLVSQILQKELSIYIEVELLPQDEYKNRLRSGNFDCALIEIVSQGSSSLKMLESFQSSNSQNYFNINHQQLDSHLEKAGNQADISKALSDYISAEKIIIDEALFVPMFFKTDYFVTSQSITNIARNPQTGIINFKYVN